MNRKKKPPAGEGERLRRLKQLLNCNFSGKYAAAIGYDREKALARCAKRRAAEGREDVGEEALSALVRYGTENGKKNRRKA